MAAIAAIVAVTALSGAATAPAAIVRVTTRADVVADDGRCSLREAIGAVNDNRPSGSRSGECAAGEPSPIVDVVKLGRGRHTLSLGGPGEDANAGGDLDVTESVVIEAGFRRSTIRSAIGAPGVAGDGDRLIHVDPHGEGGVDVVLRSIALTRGDVGCTGTRCESRASAIEVSGDGSLALEGCRVTRNRATCDGRGCAAGPPIAVRGSGDVTIDGTVVARNSTRCSRPRCAAEGSVLAVYPPSLPSPARVVLRASVVRGNEASCAADGCEVSPTIDAYAGVIDVADTSIATNVAHCAGDCLARGIVQLTAAEGATIAGLSLADNRASCIGAGCVARSILDVSIQVEPALTTRALEPMSVERAPLEAIIDLAVADSAFAGNVLSCDGQRCDLNSLVELAGDHLTVERTSLTDNLASCTGDPCQTDETLSVVADTRAALASVTLERNQARCEGAGCRTSGAVRFSGGAELAIDQATIADNTAICTGESCALGAVVRVDVERPSSLTRSLVSGNRSVCDSLACTMASGTLRNATLLVVQETEFLDNQTDDDGGAVHNEAGAKLVADRVRMRGNIAGPSADPNGGLGGAIFNDGRAGQRGILELTRCDIRDNFAVGAGGILNRGTIEILNLSALVQNSPAGTDCVNAGGGLGCP